MWTYKVFYFIERTFPDMNVKMVDTIRISPSADLHYGYRLCSNSEFSDVGISPNQTMCPIQLSHDEDLFDQHSLNYAVKHSR